MLSTTNFPHNSTNNGTVSDNTSSCDFDRTFRIVICLLLVITMVIASISNCLVCIAIISIKKLRTLTNSLLVSLSMGDILISLTLPTCEIIYVYYYPDWPLGRIGTYLLNSIWLFSLASPFVSLTVITFDRYIVIVSNVVDNRWRTSSTISLAIFLTWAYSFGVTALMAYYFSYPGEGAYEWNLLMEWYYPFLCIHIAVPLIVIIILYIKIIRISKLSRSQPSFRANINAVAMTKREVRLAQTITIVVGLLLLVWVPVLIMEYFYAVESQSCLVSKLGVVSVWVTCVNGMVNPFVYSLRSYQLRQGVGKIICCCYKRKNNNHIRRDFKSPISSSESYVKASDTPINALKRRSTDTIDSCT